MKRVGHKGADHVAPGNTVVSFEAALEAGVDVIEFDVLRLRDGRLVLAHDYSDAGKREPLTLDEGLDLFAGEVYSDVELIVDLKLPGFEAEVVEGLTARGLTDRSLVSSQYRESLEALGKLDPDLARSWSVPRARRDYTRGWLALPALVVLQVLRVRMPGQAAALLRSGGCEVLMAHWRLVTPRLERAVHGAGGQLYVWTVDDPERIRALEELGVDGVVTNDPRLFAVR
jgi:glycerophosphoryl diester phosphodiesterase